MVQGVSPSLDIVRKHDCCAIVMSNDKHSCVFHLKYFDLKALKLKEYLESGIRQFQVRCLPVKTRSVTWNKNTGNRLDSEVVEERGREGGSVR